ncbi:MAG: GAF domain-containing protein [Solirubrobacteraceae bacterium]
MTSPLRRWLSPALAGAGLVAAAREARRSARLVDQQARLIEEQAALRRVATLVATGAAPEDAFAGVANELRRLFAVELVNVCRYEPDGTFTVAAGTGAPPVGSRWPLVGKNVTTLVFETGRSVRLDSYAGATGPVADEMHQSGIRKQGMRSAVGAPVIVDGKLWGMLGIGTTLEQPLPLDTEARLASFIELVTTAIANAESRTGLARLAEEQAALRRVATLVARGVPAGEVFRAVIEEVGRLLSADFAHLGRYEANDTVTRLAGFGRTEEILAAGTQFKLGGKNVMTLVFETGRSARIDDYGDALRDFGDIARKGGVTSSVGTPIIVEGHLWGLGVVAAREALPPDTEERLAAFTELVAMAIANAESRAALAASRARIVAAADESRRRIERDLHDGAQQRLVHTVIALKLMLRALDNGDADARELAAEALRHAEQANAELRELAHGILPAALTSDGLRGGLRALLARIPLPVTAQVSVQRLPASVEATAYFLVSEALTNVLKHARADHAIVTVQAEDGRLRVEIRDDGIGGADPKGGSGLIGLSDRVHALGGTLQLTSPAGSGTTLLIQLPLEEPMGNRAAQR